MRVLSILVAVLQSEVRSGASPDAEKFRQPEPPDSIKMNSSIQEEAGADQPSTQVTHAENEALNLAKVKALVEADTAALSRTNDYGQTLLHEAAHLNFPQVAQFLIDKGARTDCKHDGGCTALEVAVIQNSLDVLDVLLAADQKQKGRLQFPPGRTEGWWVAVLLAIKSKHYDAMQRLLRHFDCGQDKRNEALVRDTYHNWLIAIVSNDDTTAFECLANHVRQQGGYRAELLFGRAEGAGFIYVLIKDALQEKSLAVFNVLTPSAAGHLSAQQVFELQTMVAKLEPENQQRVQSVSELLTAQEKALELKRAATLAELEGESAGEPKARAKGKKPNPKGRVPSNKRLPGVHLDGQDYSCSPNSSASAGPAHALAERDAAVVPPVRRLSDPVDQLARWQPARPDRSKKEKGPAPAVSFKLRRKPRLTAGPGPVHAVKQPKPSPAVVTPSPTRSAAVFSTSPRFNALVNPDSHWAAAVRGEASASLFAQDPFAIFQSSTVTSPEKGKGKGRGRD